MRIVLMGLFVLSLFPTAALCSPITFANSHIDIGNATIDTSYPMTFQLGHKRAAVIDDNGVHLTYEVDFDGHRIATVDDIERVRAESRRSCVSHEEADLLLYVALIVGLAGAGLGALLMLVTGPRLFAKTFAMRRWIMRAERARQKREAEQVALR